MNSINSSVEKWCKIQTIPPYESLCSLVNDVIEILENEICEYRPAADTKKVNDSAPGSLLEFNDNLPVIIVPDIHARPEFILNILKFKIPKRYGVHNSVITVKTALQRGLINLVCVGDAIHTEKTALRWEEIQKDFNDGIIAGKSMMKEMTSCLSALCALIQLKLNYPKHFHFLKGNHENILNVTQNGDYAFCKYADEGRMVRDFIRQEYGDDVLYLISCYENLLPLIAVGKSCVVSHAEPAKVFTRSELINARKNSQTIYSLIWTRNGDVKDNTVVPIMENLFGKENAKNSFYFGGHRPVKEKYELRQNGKYIQIHNPAEQNIAIVSGKTIFNPEQDIIGVKK